MKDASNTFYPFFLLIFVLEITMNWKIGNNNQTYPILIN